MDVTHLTINVVMALSIVVGGIIMGIQLGALKEMIKEMSSAMVDVRKIPLIETKLGQVEHVTAKIASDHNALARKVAELKGETTGRWRIPPPIDGEDR